MRKLIPIPLFFAVSVLAQTINPNSQITWPRVSGTGAPTITCPSGTNTPTTATVGTPYTDVAGPHYWQCGTAGWFQVDGGKLIPQQNDVNLTGIFATNPNYINFDDTLPAAPSGFVNATFQTDATTGRVSAYVPNTALPSFDMEVIPPISGQYAVVYPTGGVITSDPPAEASIFGNGSAAGGHFVWICAGIFCSIQGNTAAHWTGFTLPAYINPANVTAIYADAITTSGFALPTWALSDSFSGTNLTCGSQSLMVNNNTYPYSGTEVTALTSLTGANFNSLASCSIQVGGSGPGNHGQVVDVTAVRFLVFYSGPPPPVDTALHLAPPLGLNVATNTLFIDQSNNPASYLIGRPIANLPPAAAAPDQAFYTGDGVSPTDCSVGGNFAWPPTYAHLCASNGTTWAAILGGGGSGGGDTITSPGATIAVGGTSTNTTLDIDLTHPNTWTATQTFSDIIDSALTPGTSPICPNGAGGKLTTSGCSGGGGSGTVSGQASGVVGLGGSATSITSQSHINENTSGQTTVTQKLAVADGSGNAGIYQPSVGTDAGGTAGTATYTTDTTNGYAEVHEGTGALSRICTATNGICGGGGGSGVTNPGYCTTSNGNQLCLTDTTYNASPNGAVTTTTSGTTSPGTAVTLASSGCTNAHFDATSAGSRYGHEGVYIAGAGAAGANYIGTVTSCSGTSMVVTPATSTSVGSSTLVQHDESAAFNAAMSYFGTNVVSGNIWLNDGTYLVNGALLDTGGANAMINVPVIGYLSQPALTIGIQGFTATSGDNSTSQTTGATIQSSMSTTGNLIGGYNAGGGTVSNLTNIGLNVKNIRFNYAGSGDQPYATINATFMANANIQNASFQPAGGVPSCTPSHTGGQAILMPGFNNGVWNVIDNVGTVCMYNGFTFRTHTRVGSAYAYKSVNPFIFDGDGQFDSISAQYLWAQNTSGCQVSALSNDAFLNVLNLDVENDFGTYGICDPSNHLHGIINYNVYESGGGLTTINPNGAANLTLNSLKNGATQVNGSTSRSFVGITGLATSGHQATFAANGIDIVDGGVPYISSITTTGTSGAASVSGGVLNIPQYAGGGSSAMVNLLSTVTSSGCTVTGSACVFGGSTATATFSVIPGSYTDLRLSCTGRSATSGTNSDNIYIRFNGDTGSNYDWVYNQSGDFSSQATGKAVAFSQVGTLPSAGFSAGFGGSFRVEIIAYAQSNFYKAFVSDAGVWANTTVANRIYLSGDWRNTAAITSITVLTTSGSNFASGTQCTLWGIN